MKKIFTLFFALFLMVFCAKAQFVTDFEDGTLQGWTSVDVDGDGYAWCGSANPLSYFQAGVDLTGTGHNASQGFALSGSYTNVAGTALNPDNYLISPQLALTSGATLTFWVTAQDATYSAEHYAVLVSTTGTSAADFTTVFEETFTDTRDQATWQQKTVDLSAYAGQSVYIAFRHFNCTDMFVLNLDDITITNATPNASIAVSSTSIDFGTINYPGVGTAMATITAYSLTTGITATTTAPFEVSADGNTYGTTATIAQTGGTLYVKYTPTAAGTDNGTVTLTSGTITATISLTGLAIDCSNITLPLTESFESADCPATCWTIIYGNNDPTVNTMIHSATASTDGLQSFRFSSYSSTSDYTQYLITPALPAGNRMLFFDYSASNSSTEIFQVGYSSTGNNISDFTWSDTLTASSSDGWQAYVEAVPANAVYIAIKYFSNYLYYLFIDNFRVMEAGETLSANPDAMDFIGIMGTPTDAQTATFIGTSLTNDITITTAAPFEISTDNGASFAATATIPYSTTSSVMNGDLQIRYNPTTAGNHNGLVVLTSGNSSDTIVVSGNATDCSAGIASLPYLYDFNTGLYPPLCWDYNDANNFSQMIISEETGDNGIAFGAADYLSSPEIHSSSSILFSIDYATFGGSAAEAPSSFRIGYSSTTNNYSDFTWMQTVSVMTDGFNTLTEILPASTKYIAIEATAIGTYLLYGFFEYPNYMIFDNFSLEEVNEAVILAGTNTINFGNINVYGNTTETVTITGALLTEDITATTTAPFEVSADNNTFGLTATIPATGGDLYVRYAPTAAGTHTGNVTLASTGATSVTINLTGHAIDCSTAATLPFVEDFQSELDECWVMIDADGDGHNWQKKTFPGHGGEGDLCISSASYDGAALHPDNWLVTPAINLSTNANLSFWINAQDASYAGEHYGVYISTTGTDVADFTMLYEETMDANGGPRVQGAWKQKVVDLSAYTGQNVHIAFRHFNCTDMFWLNLDDIYVGEGTGINKVDENTISVYPNPANNVINVNATSNISNVEVYTIAGQKVGDFTANGTQTVISTANLSNGMYMMRINTENGVINKKFSVVR